MAEYLGLALLFVVLASMIFDLRRHHSSEIDVIWYGFLFFLFCSFSVCIFLQKKQIKKLPTFWAHP
jgi:hypothetical protein